MPLMGVSEYAAHAGVTKGTISKQIARGVIPVASRDKRGHPLVDPEAADQARDGTLNALMRRTGPPDSRGAEAADAAAVTSGDPEGASAASSDPAPDERRSSGASAPRGSSGLVEQQVLERKLRNRSLLRDNEIAEGRFVLRDVVEREQTTLARATRDKITAAVVDMSAALYGFTRQPRTEAELRVFLKDKIDAAFMGLADELRGDLDDEFGDDATDEGSDDGDRDADGGDALDDDAAGVS